MDPNATLARILDLIRDSSDTPDEREELTLALLDLAAWIAKGGFFPKLD